MSDLWMPGATQIRCSESLWGTYVAGPARGVLHTVEGDSYSPSGSSYYGHQSWPHFTIGAKIWQHIPINRAARALVNKPGGVQTNNQTAIQTEIVGRAHLAPQMPRDLLDRVKQMMRWVEQEMGVQRIAATFVASPKSNRMTESEWNSFNGWCGHQHVPENDHHDPGLIDIAYLLAQPQPTEDDMPGAFSQLCPVGQSTIVPLPPPDGGAFEGCTVYVSFAVDYTTRAEIVVGKPGKWRPVIKDDKDIPVGRQLGVKCQKGDEEVVVHNRGKQPITALVEWVK